MEDPTGNASSRKRFKLNFYGHDSNRENSRNSTDRFGTFLKKAAEREKEFKGRKLKEEYFSTLDHFRHWKVFGWQDAAFQCLDASQRGDLHPFSFESEELNTEGKSCRKFLVTSYDEFWHNYRQLTANKRHFYEIIRESSVCKLYFDLEFCKTSNPNQDTSNVMASFFELLCWYLEDAFAITFKRSDFLDLDSSTDLKFSRHVVLPNTIAFQDNRHLGKFVSEFIQILRNTQLEGQKLLSWSLRDYAKKLFFLDKHGQTVCLIDSGVYTKNRAFRLFLSSKFEKRIPLSLAKDNYFRVNDEKQTFLASLICNVQSNVKVLSWDKGDSLLIKKCPNPPQSSQPKSPTAQSHSPYRSIDDHVLNHIIRDENVQGSIRRSLFFEESKLLVYDIKTYRFCRRVGRHHASNNIQILVDLVRNVWYQKCLDPECCGFRSNEFPLPLSALTSIRTLDDFDDDDDDLFEQVVKLETQREKFQQLESSKEPSQDELDDALFTEAAKKFEATHKIDREFSDEEFPDIESIIND